MRENDGEMQGMKGSAAAGGLLDGTAGAESRMEASATVEISGYLRQSRVRESEGLSPVPSSLFFRLLFLGAQVLGRLKGLQRVAVLGRHSI